MTSSSNLDIALLDPVQQDKSMTINAAIAAMDKSLSDTLSVDASVHVSPYTIPYDSTQDEPAGIKTALRFIKLKITGALGADWTAYLPAVKKKLFIVENKTTGLHNVIVKVSGQTGVTVGANQAVICYLDGTDVFALSVTPISGPADWYGYAPGKPVASQLIFRARMLRALSLPASLTGSYADCDVAPTGSIQLALAKNGSSIGTINFAGGATVATFTFASEVDFAVGDLFTITAPGSPDATFSGPSWSLLGSR